MVDEKSAASYRHFNLGELVERLHDRDPGVRRAAAEALGDPRSSEAIEPLIACLHDDDKRVHWAASRTLAELAEPAVSCPIDAMDDPNLSKNERHTGIMRAGGDADDRGPWRRRMGRTETEAS